MFLINDANVLLKFENLNIKILRINKEVFFDSFPRHKHGKDLYELHYVVGGRGSLVTDSGTYDLKRKFLYMTGPMVYHEQITDDKDPLEEYCIQMEINKGKNVSSIGELICKNTFWYGEDKFNSASFFEQLEEESKNKGVGFTEAIKSLVALVLVALVRNYAGNNYLNVYEKNTPEYMRISITEESFFNDYDKLTLDTLSDRLKLSRRQTQRFLEKTFSKTFSEILMETRLNKAKEFIRSGMSIKEAAELVGYEDVRSLKSKLK